MRVDKEHTEHGVQSARFGALDDIRASGDYAVGLYAFGDIADRRFVLAYALGEVDVDENFLTRGVSAFHRFAHGEQFAL